MLVVALASADWTTAALVSLLAVSTRTMSLVALLVLDVSVVSIMAGGAPWSSESDEASEDVEKA